MGKLICYDIYPRKNDNIERMHKLLTKYGFNKKEGRYGPYFHAEVGRWDSFRIKNLILCHNYKHKKYDKRWDRDESYRSEFFKHYHGPYRCAYCGKHITAKTLEVDHLIPVAKAKSSVLARFLLRMNTIYNVNNYRNLVPACHNCNQSKSDKMGLWVVVGSFGRHRWFWPVFEALVFIAIISVVIIMAMSMGAFDSFIESVNQLMQMI